MFQTPLELLDYIPSSKDGEVVRDGEAAGDGGAGDGEVDGEAAGDGGAEDGEVDGEAAGEGEAGDRETAGDGDGAGDGETAGDGDGAGETAGVGDSAGDGDGAGETAGDGEVVGDGDGAGDAEAARKKEQSSHQQTLAWRTNFMDGHNDSPAILAKNMYPDPINVTTVTQEEKWMVEKNTDDKPRPGTTFKTKDVFTVRDMCKVLCNRFKYDMENAGLKLDWVHSKKIMWDPDIRSMDPEDPDLEKKVPEPRFHPRNSKVPFFCKNCMNQQKNLGLVANGKLLVDMSKLENAGGGRLQLQRPVKDSEIGYFSLEIEEIFYHSCECEKPFSSTFETYRDKGYVILKAPWQWLFSCTFDGISAKLESWKAPVFFAKDTSDDEKKELKKHRPNVTVQEEEGDWVGPGLRLNHGNKNYKYDDCAMIPLPGTPFHEDLSMEDYRRCMARLNFLIVCQLGIEADASPFVFDTDGFKAKWSEGQSAKKAKMMKSKQAKSSENVDPRKAPRAKGKEVGFVKCSKRNQKNHISMKAVSVLFGGNERNICAGGPIHQFCHVDVGYNIRTDPGTFVPGSFTVPLTADGRSIYIATLHQQVLVPLGSMLLLRGDVPHGGITATASPNPLHRAAIHGYMDSKDLFRKQTLATDPGLYRPPQHMLLLEPERREEIVENIYWEFHRNLQAFATLSDVSKCKSKNLAKIAHAISSSPEFGSLLEVQPTSTHDMDT